MSGTGAILLAIFCSSFLLTSFIAGFLNQKEKKINDQKIQEDAQKYLEENLGNNFFGNLYRSGRRLDTALERSTKTPGPFYGLVNCPKCQTFAFHHIHKYTNQHVIRECVNQECAKKWKQLR